MNIQLKSRTRKSGIIPVTCLDSIMAEMLNVSPDAFQLYNGEFTTFDRFSNQLQVFTFFSGAGLFTSNKKNEFYIVFQGLPEVAGMSAAEELEMLDHLRLAKNHFLKIRSMIDLGQMSLRITRF